MHTNRPKASTVPRAYLRTIIIPQNEDNNVHNMTTETSASFHLVPRVNTCFEYNING